MEQTNERIMKQSLEEIDVEIDVEAIPAGEQKTDQETKPKTLAKLRADMYRAACSGTWADAEKILKEHRNFTSDYISSAGDTSLHVAVVKGQKYFVEKLIKRMSIEEMYTSDGRGYTACCYATEKSMAEILVKKDPGEITRPGTNNKTPLKMAATYGNNDVVRYFLTHAQVEKQPHEYWLDILQELIRKEMFDVSLEMVRDDKFYFLACATNSEGTALHALARVEEPVTTSECEKGNEGASFKSHQELAEFLWDKMQQMEDVDEVISKPSVLHVAASTGNAHLVKMIINDFPALMWLLDCESRTIFHVAVIHRRKDILSLLPSQDTLERLLLISRNAQGYTILHLAVKPPRPLMGVNQLLILKQEIAWFEFVSKMVPEECKKMTNNEGHTPKQMFYKENNEFIKHYLAWTKSTASNGLLISTVIFSSMCAALFAVPGGYNQVSGIPVFWNQFGFYLLVILEFLSVCFSCTTIIALLNILINTEDNLSIKMRDPFFFMAGSLVFASGAFLIGCGLVTMGYASKWFEVVRILATICTVLLSSLFVNFFVLLRRKGFISTY